MAGKPEYDVGDLVTFVKSPYHDEYAEEFKSFVEKGDNAIFEVVDFSFKEDEYTHADGFLYTLKPYNDRARQLTDDWLGLSKVGGIGPYDIGKSRLETAEDLEKLYQ